MKPELTPEQLAAMEQLNDKDAKIDVDAFNKLMKGTGIKILHLSEQQKKDIEMSEKTTKAEIQAYIDDLRSKNKTSRQIRRSVFMKYKTKINIDYKAK